MIILHWYIIFNVDAYYIAIFAHSIYLYHIICVLNNGVLHAEN